MASLLIRIAVNLIIGGVAFVMGLIFIVSILLFIFNMISLIFLIFFIPIWFVILILERELIWNLIFLLKKAPHRNLSKTSGNHEKLLEDYLSLKKIFEKESLELSNENQIKTSESLEEAQKIFHINK